MEGKAAGVARVVESVVSVAGSGVSSVLAEVTAFRARLAGVDVKGLSDAERVELVAELERVKGAACSAQARATDALRRSREVAAPRDAGRSVGSEVALARRESPSLGDRFVGLARALVHEMPSTMRALTSGVIGERHAVAVVQATATLSAEHRVEVDRRIAPLLGRLGVGATGRAARRVAAELDAASVVRRMEEAARVPRKRRPSATRTSLPTRARSREVEVRTPTGRTFRVQSPPLTGWGWRPPPPRSRGAPAADGTASALERHLASLLGDAA